MQECNVSDITKWLQEFEFDKDKGGLVCGWQVGGGHIVRRSENIRDYSVSKVVDGFANIVKKPSFMD